MRWYETDPDRFDDEIAALDQAGFLYEVNENWRAKGVIVIEVAVDIGGTEYLLTARYPAYYPHFAFTVVAPPELELSAHIDPYHRDLCLLADVQKNWSTKDTLAGFLRTQLPALISANSDAVARTHLEAHEAEVITSYFPYLDGTILFTCPVDLPSSVDRGYLKIAPEKGWSGGLHFRGVILEVTDLNKKTITVQSPELCSQDSIDSFFWGRWISLNAPPEENDLNHVLDEAVESWSDLKKPLFNGGPDITCLYVPEQTGYGKVGRNWIPVVREKVKEGKSRERKVRSYFCRPNRGTRSDVAARTPRLEGLSQKAAIVVGLGSLGSSIAGQLARAGIGSLRLVDHDVLDIGNTPRWLLGKNYVGHHKVSALSHYLKVSYPYLNIEPKYVLGMKIGNPYLEPEHLEAFENALKGVDLIIDATAEWSVNYFLAAKARDLQVPFLWATATHGGWGGAIGRVVPGETEGCWKCYQRSLYDGSIPVPPQEPSGLVQPFGCFSPTFTGAGFDLDHVSLGAVRLAVSTLISGRDHGYPDFSWDVAISRTWDEGTQLPIAAEWKTFSLTKHAQCDCWQQPQL